MTSVATTAPTGPDRTVGGETGPGLPAAGAALPAEPGAAGSGQAPAGSGQAAAEPGGRRPAGGTRKRLDHIDAMRPVKQAGVVSTHTLLAFAPVAAGLSSGAALMLLHVTREAFLFVSACMLTYSYRQLQALDLGHFYRRRFSSVGVPYLVWTVIYFLFLLPTSHRSVAGSFGHLGYLMGTGYYQLYYLLVIIEFYAIFPLLLMLLRRTVGHHGLLLVASGAVQLAMVSLTHWGVLPSDMQGFWATRDIVFYQFYLVAGMVVALHLDEAHRWLCRHAALVVGFTVVTAALAEAWYFLAAYHVVSWLGPASDPLQPVVVPFNVGAIAAIYLIGVYLVGRGRSPRTRAMVHSGSENSYGIYLEQMIFITALGWLGWEHLVGVVPWPVLSVVTVALVFGACTLLTSILARTRLAKPLTGRSRVSWASWWPSRTAAGTAGGPLEPSPAG